DVRLEQVAATGQGRAVGGERGHLRCVDHGGLGGRELGGRAVGGRVGLDDLAVLSGQVGGRETVHDRVLSGRTGRVVDQDHADATAVADLAALVDQCVGAPGADHDLAGRSLVI